MGLQRKLNEYRCNSIKCLQCVVSSILRTVYHLSTKYWIVMSDLIDIDQSADNCIHVCTIVFGTAMVAGLFNYRLTQRLHGISSRRTGVASYFVMLNLECLSHFINSHTDRSWPSCFLLRFEIMEFIYHSKLVCGVYTNITYLILYDVSPL